MKKILFIFIIVIVIVSTISYIYLNYKASSNVAKRENIEYTNYYNKEITGADVATIINKAMNNNEVKDVEKDEKGNYKNNDEDSIIIDIRFIDNDKVYKMESIYNGGTENFIEFYSSIKFKCTKMEYHKKTGQVSYMYIEQISTGN